jgi:hypothetical protein
MLKFYLISLIPVAVGGALWVMRTIKLQNQ